MTNQIFKQKVNIDLLFELFEKTCFKETKYYMFDLNCFKKGIYDNSIQLFLDEIKECYHKSKQKYVEKKITYNSFTTILRQILKSNNVPFYSKIVYNKSEYCIVYYIYF